MALGSEDITAWKTVAANNDGSDAAIDWHEHQQRKSVNDSARSMMAALAKQRDMTNGTIITGGTADAQTFTTPVNYGSAATPVGLRVRLKIGISYSGAAALSLKMDAGTPAGVKNLRGNAPTPAEWVANTYVDLVWDSTYWNMVTALPGVFTPDLLNHGRFVADSGNNQRCLFVPYNGDQVKINGSVYKIPSAGISFPNAGTVVNGVAATNLGINTTYWAALYDPGSGTPTPCYFNTGGTMHLIDTTAGNVGTHVCIDGRFTLVGLVHTWAASGAGGSFVDTPDKRWVLSWFNQRKKSIRGAMMSNVPGIVGPNPGGPGTSVADLGTTYWAQSLIWGDGEPSAQSTPPCFHAGWAEMIGVHNTGGDTLYFAIGLNGVSQGTNAQFAAAANVAYGTCCVAEIETVEGWNTLHLMGGSASAFGAINFYGRVVSEVWG